MSKVIYLLVAILLSLCSCEKSQEFKAYVAFRSGINDDYSRAPAAYRSLSDQEKMAVYIGAIEIRPPDTAITELVRDESFDFMLALRDNIKSRDNYVAAFDYVIQVRSLIREGKLSSGEVAKLQLDDLCRSLSSQSEACLEILNVP